jgi:hypothetical protein
MMAKFLPQSGPRQGSGDMGTEDRTCACGADDFGLLGQFTANLGLFDLGDFRSVLGRPEDFDVSDWAGTDNCNFQSHGE